MALTTLLPYATGACGLLFTKGPPPGYERMDSFTCTESDAGPAVDASFAVLNVLGLLFIAGNPDEYQGTGGAVAEAVALSVIWGISAVVGFPKAKQCRVALRQLAVRQARAQDTSAAPGPRVESPGIRAVVVSPATDTMSVGQTVQLVVDAFASSGTVIPNRTFTWSSSNDAIASVSNAGLVTAHAGGVAVIAANTDNVVGTASIVVTSPR